MDCCLPGSSVHGNLQARTLEWVPFPSPGDRLNPRIEPRSPALQADSLSSEPPWKPTNSLRYIKGMELKHLLLSCRHIPMV